MNVEYLPLLLVYVGGALSISFLCSLLEATLLSVRITELMGRAQDGDAGAQRLLDLKQNRLDDSISAILTLNTIAHTIGAALAGAQAAKVFGGGSVSEETAVAAFSAVLTVLVLVVTEIIPKTLGTVYGSSLAGFVGRTIKILTVLLAPLLVVTRFLTRLVAHGHAEGISRGELVALVGMAHEEGAIADNESKVLSNLLTFDALAVVDVMTPRTVIQMLPSSTTLGTYVADDAMHHHSRLPVFEGTRDRVLGYVHQRELLLAAARDEPVDTEVTAFLRPIASVNEDAPLGEALRTFLEGGDHIAMAIDEFGGTAGLVTLEDVVETLLGAEIVDEADRVADLRALAAELRDKRLARRPPAPGDPKP